MEPARDKYNALFELWDINADKDKSTGADLKYQMEEDLADNWDLFYYQN